MSREHVTMQRLLEGLDRSSSERPPRGATGVVHQDVHRPHLGDESVDRGSEARVVFEVGDETSGGRRPRSDELGNQRVEGRLPASQRGDVGPLFREGQRRRATDALAGPAHEGVTTDERQVHHALPS